MEKVTTVCPYCAAGCKLRLVVDELETLVSKKYWTLPTYADLLYSVQ